MEANSTFNRAAAPIGPQDALISSTARSNCPGGRVSVHTVGFIIHTVGYIIHTVGYIIHTVGYIIHTVGYIAKKDVFVLRNS